MAAVLAGCGTPGAPLPPSLNLPDRVTDLSAERVGDQVTLTWTMPKRNTDKIPLKVDIDVDVCRAEAKGHCQFIGHLRLAPNADGTFIENLPPALATGAPRVLYYYVELKNNRGRSAGPSDAGPVVAGQAPAALTGLAAEVRKVGVVLRWDPADAAADVRLRRTLLTPPTAEKHPGRLPEPAQPLEENLWIDSSKANAARALDPHIEFGNTYEYRAQRVIHIPIAGETLELDGALSPPVRVDARDIFPPAEPTGLAAVAVAPDASQGIESSIDLSWEPDTEADLAGYEVYRREDTTPWERISGDQPVVGPTYHDAHVLPGHTYRYAVSAVDHAGHESGRSSEASETVPKS
jgi:hypothetical protein